MSPATEIPTKRLLLDLLNEGPIMLYDGTCVFCNGAANFAFNKEVTQQLRFASLQSPIGQQLLVYFGLPQTNFKTFVIINEQTAYIKFEAAIQLGYLIGGHYSRLARILDTLVPDFIGNPIYSLLWPLRKIFGSRDQCIIPNAAMRSRVIESSIS